MVRWERETRWTLFAAAAAIFGCSPTEPEMDSGLIVNGGFEVERQTPHPLIGPTPEGWFPSLISSLSQYHTLALDSENTHNGRHAVMIRIHADHPSDGDFQFYRWMQEVTEGFEPGASYQFEAWGRTSNVTRMDLAFIEVRVYDAGGSQVGREWAYVPNPGGDPLEWQRVAFPLSLPASAASLIIQAGIVAPHNAGATVWFDDLSLLPVGG